MKEYSKGIYVKFKPEEVEILHDRMKEAGVQNMSAYIRKMALPSLGHLCRRLSTSKKMRMGRLR